MRRINNMIACEGLVRCGETGVSTTLNAVRERSAVKVARSVLRGPYAREGMGLPFYEQEVVKAFRQTDSQIIGQLLLCLHERKRVIGSRAGQSLAPADP
jgi:hypothetical protein